MSWTTTLHLPSNRIRRYALLALAALFVLAGVAHFVRPAVYLPMMPPYLPAPLLLIYLSGAVEIAGGLGVLHPKLRAAAGWGLVALLVVFLTVHVHMALHPEAFDLPAWALWARIPFQGVLIAWAYWATRPTPAAPAA